MHIRDRVKELRRVRAAELRPHPRNWRTHPARQRDALRGLLAEIGYADALLAREMPDGSLMLIDGHLRAETTPDQLVPVLVLDVDETEAATILATLDTITGLAGVDAAQFAELTREVQIDSPAARSLLEDVARTAELLDPGEPCGAPDETDRLRERFQILIDCRDEQEQSELLLQLHRDGHRCRALIA